MIDTQNVLTNEGLDKNLLHFRPISAKVMNLAGHGSVALKKILTNNQWNARTVSFLATASYVAGSVIAIPLALIEAVTLQAILGLGLMANALTNGKYASIKKFNTQCAAYSLESVVQMAITIARLVLNKVPQFSTEVTVCDHGIHLLTGAFAYFVNLAIQSQGKQEPELSRFRNERIPLFVPLILEGIQGAWKEMLQSLARDLGSEGTLEHIIERIGLSQESQNILREVFMNLELSRFTERGYLTSISHRLQPVLLEIQRSVGATEVGRTTVIGPQNRTEAKYQEHLIACTKEAVKRVYNDDRLAACFDEDKNQDIHIAARAGRDAIEGFYPGPTIPLASIAQLVEIEKFSVTDGTKCPENFQGRLELYNDRHGKIKTLSEKLNQLTPEERLELVLRILRGSDYSVAGIIHQEEFTELLKGIGELGGAIHQGNLMGVLTLHMRANPVEAQNMFAKAWQDAVQDLTSSV